MEVAGHAWAPGDGHMGFAGGRGGWRHWPACGGSSHRELQVCIACQHAHNLLVGACSHRLLVHGDNFIPYQQLAMGQPTCQDVMDDLAAAACVLAACNV